MWIVQIAFSRPYTLIVLALVLFLFAPVCAPLAMAVDLRQHNGKGVVRTGKIVPGTSWVVEMLEVTNSYVREASKPAIRRLHAVWRSEFKGLRSFRNLHRGSTLEGFTPSWNYRKISAQLQREAALL